MALMDVFTHFSIIRRERRGIRPEEIKIRVDAESAEIYESAIFADRQKLDALLSLRLKEFARKRRPLEAVMSDISRKAQARGLTPEILSNLLSE
jgi:hypothetical protein